MNVWHSLHAPLPAENAAGLVEFEIVVPDRVTLDAARQRFDKAGFQTSGNADSFRAADPWKIPFRMRAA
jgi:catechol-2,3-dioxygenase